jgi:transcriptional regulator with XRE-family HTH domain
LQAKSQIVTIPAGRARGYVGGMPFDPEKIRRAARRIMREKGLKMSTWSARAGKGERTFAAFLHGSTRSPTVETVYLYAEAAGVEPAELLGIEPVASISTGAFRAMMALLERVEREQACSGEALQSIRELAAAIASELRPER